MVGLLQDLRIGEEGGSQWSAQLGKACQQGPREAWWHGRVNVDRVGSVEGIRLVGSVLFSSAVYVFGGLESLFSRQSSCNCVTSSELGATFSSSLG